MNPPPAQDDERAMSEINTTPLVDVMLVLLIVFMITIPVITQTVPSTVTVRSSGISR
jgi:biopolymer transport protein ExbD